MQVAMHPAPAGGQAGLVGKESVSAAIPKLRAVFLRPAPAGPAVSASAMPPVASVPPQHHPLRAEPIQKADPTIQPQSAKTPKARRKAGSTFLKSLLLLFRICFFIIHVFMLTVGLSAIIGASGLWWVANHQKEANRMAAATLEYMDKNKDHLKPATDFMDLVFDALLPSKVKPGPDNPEVSP